MINRSVRMNYHTNLLELEEHMYPLVDVETPNVFHNLFQILWHDRQGGREYPKRGHYLGGGGGVGGDGEGGGLLWYLK